MKRIGKRKHEKYINEKKKKKVIKEEWKQMKQGKEIQ
jgi:hypothetical protein